MVTASSAATVGRTISHAKSGASDRCGRGRRATRAAGLHPAAVAPPCRLVVAIASAPPPAPLGPAEELSVRLLDQAECLVLLERVAPELGLVLLVELVGDVVPRACRVVERLRRILLAGDGLVHGEVERVLVLGGARNVDLREAVLEGGLDRGEVE